MVLADQRAVLPRLPGTLTLTGLVSAFLLVAITFATRQNLWTDEATQLTGVSLGFTEQLRWLAGRLPQLGSVPLDRTPPLSYWLWSVWTTIFGRGIFAARCLSVSLSVASILTLHALARRTLGPRAALLSAALLALSPNFLVQAVEIRPYAALILCSVFLLWSYLRLLDGRPEPSRLDLWTFALAAALCSYVHYFGVLISAGTSACIVLAYAMGGDRAKLPAVMRRAIWPLVFYVASFLALIPLLASAFRLSAAAGSGSVLPLDIRAHDALRLIYRLFSHQSMLGIPGLSAAAALSGLGLISLAATRGADPRVRRLLLMLGVNMALVGLVGATAHAFDAFTPSYNCWTLPVLALLGAGTTRHRDVWVRYIGMGFMCVLLAADGYGASRLALKGQMYAHTRSTALKSEIDQAGLSNVAVLYLDDAAATYFALQYYYNGRLPQYVTLDDTLRPVGVSGPSAVKLRDLHVATLLVARDQQLSAEELEFLSRHPDSHTGAYQALDEFLNSHRAELATRWTLVSRHEYLAQSALAFAVLKSHAPGS